MWRVMFKNKKKEINVLVKRVHFPYANKIFNSPNDHGFLPHNQSILPPSRGVVGSTSP